MDSPEYTVEIDLAAEKEFDALDKGDQRKAARLIQELAQTGTSRAGRMKHTEASLWRRKVGDIRVIFFFEAGAKYIKVLVVRRRDSDTYADLKKLASKAKRS